MLLIDRPTDDASKTSHFIRILFGRLDTKQDLLHTYADLLLISKTTNALERLLYFLRRERPRLFQNASQLLMRINSRDQDI